MQATLKAQTHKSFRFQNFKKKKAFIKYYLHAKHSKFEKHKSYRANTNQNFLSKLINQLCDTHFQKYSFFLFY